MPNEQKIKLTEQLKFFMTSTLSFHKLKKNFKFRTPMAVSLTKIAIKSLMRIN